MLLPPNRTGQDGNEELAKFGQAKAPAPPTLANACAAKVGQAFPPAHALLFPQFRKFLESACPTKTSQFLVHSWLSARQGGAGVPPARVSANSHTLEILKHPSLRTRPSVPAGPEFCAPIPGSGHRPP